jgi:hypothetical protein
MGRVLLPVVYRPLELHMALAHSDQELSSVLQ